MTALPEMNTGSFYAALQQWPGLEHDLGDVLEIGILSVDADLVIQGWNRWLENASGLSESAVLNRCLLEVYPGLAGSRAEAAFRDAAAGTPVVMSQRFHGYVLPFAATTGAAGFTYMQQSARLLPLRHGDGMPSGVLALIEDVTERVARERELKEAIEAAQAASKAKSDFLAAMSHELRTPLGAIIGYADLVASGVVGPVTELQQDHLGRLKAGAYHLLGIVEEILSFARTEAGRSQVRLDHTDAITLARDALAAVEPQLRSKRLGLKVEVACDALPMVTDAGKARQIIINLLGNAVKFTDDGEIVFRVDQLDAGTVRYSVGDTGPGIAPENQQRIFEPFTQLEQPWARIKGGTGLGLPVSVRLARLLGGSVNLESEVGKGSVFTLCLPLQPPVTPPPPADTPTI